MIAFEDKRNDDFDRHYDRRWQGSHKICEFDHYDELVSSQGAHFHIWIPAIATIADVTRAWEKIRRTRDMVSWSWSYIPTVEIPA